MSVPNCDSIADISGRMTNPEWHREPVNQAGAFHTEEKILQRPAGEDPYFSLEPGCHEWPFSFLIRGYQLETLEGLDPSYYKYQLKARVTRPTFAKNRKIVKPVRVIRTYDPSSATLYRLCSMERTWIGKLRYTFSTPSKGVVFGSVVPFEIVLVPLIKGLRIKRIETLLLEIHEFYFRYDAYPLVPKKPMFMESTIAADDYYVPENIESVDIDGAEGYRFARQIQIPKSLKECRLSLDPITPHSRTAHRHPILHIRHCLRFEVHIVNPCDGHVSVLKCRLHIVIFLTPNQRLGTQLELLNPGVIPMTMNPDIVSSDFVVPPPYGQHEGDETLNAQDMSNSGLATPNALLSSRASTANIQELQNRDQQLSPNTLVHRLSNLLLGSNRSARDARNAAREDLQDSGGPSAATSSNTDYYSFPLPPGVRPSNAETGQFFSDLQTPVHLEYDNEALAQVPSYNTAARQPEPSADSQAGLPTYDEITSTPTRAEQSTARSSEINPRNNQTASTPTRAEQLTTTHTDQTASIPTQTQQSTTTSSEANSRTDKTTSSPIRAEQSTATSGEANPRTDEGGEAN